MCACLYVPIQIDTYKGVHIRYTHSFTLRWTEYVYRHSHIQYARECMSKPIHLYLRPYNILIQMNNKSIAYVVTHLYVCMYVYNCLSVLMCVYERICILRVCVCVSVCVYVCLCMYVLTLTYNMYYICRLNVAMR